MSPEMRSRPQSAVGDLQHSIPAPHSPAHANLQRDKGKTSKSSNFLFLSKHLPPLDLSARHPRGGFTSISNPNVSKGLEIEKGAYETASNILVKNL
jgi:hypothetical protein